MESAGKRTRRPPERLADEQVEAEKKRRREKKAVASAASKTSSSTNASRGKLLKKELAKYNLTRRKDSTLCDAFVKGTTTKSVEEVAIIMCRFKYLYEGYCKEFNNEIDRIDREIDDEVDNIAEYSRDPFAGFEGYYRGIRGDACREVTGYYSFADVKRDMANGWKNFPEKWPWM